MNLILIEDDDVFITNFKQICCSETAKVNIINFYNVNDFIDFIYNNEMLINGIFINTSMQMVNCIPLIANLQSKIKNIPVIFISDFPEKECQQIFLESPFFKPFGFIKKPIEASVLKTILRQIHILHSKINIIINKSANKKVIVPTDSIIYVESEKRKIIIHTDNDEYTMYAKLKDFQKKLPDNFLMPHSSFVVNCNNIQSYNANTLYLSNECMIPISRNFKKEFISNLKAQKL